MIAIPGYLAAFNVREMFIEEHRRISDEISRATSANHPGQWPSIAQGNPAQSLTSTADTIDAGKSGPVDFEHLIMPSAPALARPPSYWSPRGVRSDPLACFDEWAENLDEVWFQPPREKPIKLSFPILDRRPDTLMGPENCYLTRGTYQFLDQKTLCVSVKRWAGAGDSIAQVKQLLGMENLDILKPDMVRTLERMLDVLGNGSLTASCVEAWLPYEGYAWVYPTPTKRSLTALRKTIGEIIAPATRGLTELEKAVEWFSVNHLGSRPTNQQMKYLIADYSKITGKFFGDTFFRNVEKAIWPKLP